MAAAKLDSEKERGEFDSLVKDLERRLASSGRENRRLAELVEINEGALVRNEGEFVSLRAEVQRLGDCIDRRDLEISQLSGCLD